MYECIYYVCLSMCVFVHACVCVCVRERDLAKEWRNYLVINNIFSSDIESHSICTFSQLFGWVEIEGDPMLGRDNTGITARTMRCASLH